MEDGWLGIDLEGELMGGVDRFKVGGRFFRDDLGR